MKLTQKQALQLFTLLQSSLSMNVVGYLCYNTEQRTMILNEIIDQQDGESLIELTQIIMRKQDAD